MEPWTFLFGLGVLVLAVLVVTYRLDQRRREKFAGVRGAAWSHPGQGPWIAGGVNVGDSGCGGADGGGCSS